MIFVGDIALPYTNAIVLNEFPNKLQQKNWFANLEGSIVDNINNKFQTRRAVFNDRESIKAINDFFHFSGFALANNHIFDVNNFKQTIDFLNDLEIPFCGIGSNIKEARQPLILYENDIQLVILNFGWEVIQCELATKYKQGVNALTKENVLMSIKDTINNYPNAKIIPYMHWCYELEAEPQPFERELAKKMIDLGAAGVIGSHPHRIGGFETYKNKPIVYSLGNWMIKQNYYFNGKLTFPNFCNVELAFEWDLSTNEYLFHFFRYDKEKSTLTYVGTEDENSPTMIKHTPFLNLSNKEYKSWYKKNRYHKNKGLPIYYWEDSPWQVGMKNNWNKTRDRLLKVLLNKGK